MKLIPHLFLALICSVNIAFAQSSSNSSTSKSYPPKSSSVGDEYSQDTYITRGGAVVDAKGRERSEDANKKLMKSLGYEHYPVGEGLDEKDWVEDKFAMPQKELLVGCAYSPGYSFPSVCGDRKGNIIFDSSKHKQDVLDKIIKAQGKKGKYNKMPNGGPITEKDLGVD